MHANTNTRNLGTPRTRVLVPVVLAAASHAALAQQAIFEESFDNPGLVPIGQWGPANLIAKGWTFDNNSLPLGSIGWWGGFGWEPVVVPLSEGSYLAASADSAAGAPAIYSLWSILPAIPGQAQGDVLTFYTVSSDTSSFDNASLEVRYSPSGGTNTGASAPDVGDFTTALLGISTIPNYNEGIYDGWTKWQVTLPGPGRIAFRQNGTQSLYFGIDDVSVVTPPPVEGVVPESFEDLGGQCGEGPCKLVDKGWIFVDQGTLQDQPAWRPKTNALDFDAYDGSSYMKSSQAGITGSVATWAILPEIPGASAGETVGFFVRGGLGVGATFEVRYSPTGLIGTGTGHAGTGNFTQVLYTTSTLFDGWQLVEVTLPGSGRVAFRLHDSDQVYFDAQSLVAVDALTFGDTPLDFPIPQPGESVVWGAELSPITIASDLVIPPGAEVIVEPGVTVNIEWDTTITVAGAFTAIGTEAAPITIESVANFPPGIEFTGEVTLTHTVINTQLRPNQHGSLIMDQSHMHGPNGTIFNPSLLVIDESGGPCFIDITDCTFEDVLVYPSDAIIAMRDSTFTNSSALPLRGYFFVDNLTFNGGSLSLGKDQQPGYINNIEVANSPGAGLNLGGGNFGNDYFIGPDTSLTNNAYPASVGSAGILPGSTLPASGNGVNAVLLQSEGGSFRGPIHWADPGIPYRGIAELPWIEGSATVLPGVTMEFNQNAGFYESPGLQTRGLPDAPITFTSVNAAKWYGIFVPYRMENTIIDNSVWGIINAAVGLPGYYDGCTFSSNDRGIVGSAIIRKTLFTQNVVGADIGFTEDLDGQTNPNSFIDNTLAVQDASDATHNWWGDPTGPMSPQNPGGQGDAAAAGVPVIPFLTAPPSGNPPPVVTLRDGYFMARPGDRFILSWDIVDTELATQRILMSTQFDYPAQYSVVADGIPATQRSFVFTAPEAGNFHIRVEAVDALGQVGWDHREMVSTAIELDQDIVPGEAITLGYPLPLGGEVTHFYSGWILLDDQFRYESFGAAGVLPPEIMASTDTVRIGLQTPEGGWLVDDAFVSRPDARLGDAAPTVSFTQPPSGTYTGGSTVSFDWTASDDESIRSFNLQASYDGGLTWHAIASDVPGTQTHYDWVLPPIDSAMTDVLVRVVAFDLRFQSVSATAGPIVLDSGLADPGLPGDMNFDGSVNSDDLNAVLGAFGCLSGPCGGDVNKDGRTDSMDLNMVLANFGSQMP